MACFTVTLLAAGGASVARAIISKKEEKNPYIVSSNSKFGSDTKWSTKLRYLELSLYGGSFILAGEHLLHGEISVYPPFITAFNSFESTQGMLFEMATVGVAMLLTLCFVWGIGIFLTDLIKYRKRIKTVKAKE